MPIKDMYDATSLQLCRSSMSLLLPFYVFLTSPVLICNFGLHICLLYINQSKKITSRIKNGCSKEMSDTDKKTPFNGYKGFGYSRRSVYGFWNLSSATTCTIFKQKSSHSVFARNGQAGGRNYLQNYCMDELCASSSIIRYVQIAFKVLYIVLCFGDDSSRATEIRVWVLQRNHTRSAMVMGCCLRMNHTCIVVAQNNIVLEWFMYLS
ncbi:hypothetical protein IGI04_006830, partial [Brassica rapa subsp. trilocularis]